MKNLATALIIGLVTQTTFAESKHIASYYCKAERMRTPGSAIVVSSKFEFNLRKDTNTEAYELSDLVGHADFNYDFNIDETSPNYYGVFSLKKLPNNQNYRGRTYTNHLQFPEFNAIATGNHDGGGMYGAFILSKEEKEEVSAHYILQSGDHIGGTIDYKCYRN